MFFEEIPTNTLRANGSVFTGFSNPQTGATHRERRVSNREADTQLFWLAMSYIGLYGLWGTGSLETHGTIPNTPERLRAKLSAAAQILPEANNRVDLVLEYQNLLHKNAIIPRVVILSLGDEKNIPQEYWDLFCYWYMSEVGTQELAKAFEQRFDGILNMTAWEACLASKESSGERSPRQIFEEIVDQALEDASLTLEPMVSLAPTTDHALAVKTVFYVVLAREGVSPDGLIGIINGLVEQAPLDYFTNVEGQTFRTDRDGLFQLLFEGLMIPAIPLWEERDTSSLNSVQHLLEIIQFFEDICIFLYRSSTTFKKLFSVPE